MNDDMHPAYDDAAGSSADTVQLPAELALLPLLNMVVYPLTVMPLAVGQQASVRLIDDAIAGQRIVALAALKNERQRVEPITAADFYPVGTAAIVHRLLRLPDKTLRVALQGVERIMIGDVLRTSPYLRAQVQVFPEQAGHSAEIAVLVQQLRAAVHDMWLILPHTSDEVREQIANEADPRRLAYLVATNMLVRSSTAERQAILELPNVAAKLQRLAALLAHELQVLRKGAVR